MVEAFSSNFRPVAAFFLTFNATPPLVRLCPVSAPDASGLDASLFRVRLEPLAILAAEAERPPDRDDAAVPIENFEVTVLRWLDGIWACGVWNRAIMQLIRIKMALDLS